MLLKSHKVQESLSSQAQIPSNTSGSKGIREWCYTCWLLPSCTSAWDLSVHNIQSLGYIQFESLHNSACIFHNLSHVLFQTGLLLKLNHHVEATENTICICSNILINWRHFSYDFMYILWCKYVQAITEALYTSSPWLTTGCLAIVRSYDLPGKRQSQPILKFRWLLPHLWSHNCTLGILVAIVAILGLCQVITGLTYKAGHPLHLAFILEKIEYDLVLGKYFLQSFCQGQLTFLWE